MERWPAHLYRQRAQARGLSPELATRALGRAARLADSGLPPILTLGHLAREAGVEHGYLRQVVRSAREHYTVFHIKKRGGDGWRRIGVPNSELAAAQRWISRGILSRIPPHAASHAFHPGSSVVACAKQHCGARWLIKLDLKNFFESIEERRVYEVFQGAGFGELISFELSRLCTVNLHRRPAGYSWTEEREGLPYAVIDRKRHLAQGAPSSPMLSNLVVRSLDERLASIATRQALVYTRYADDLTFSTSKREFSRVDAMRVLKQLKRGVARSRLKLNGRKIGVVPPGARKVVLGLVVDGELPSLPREFRNRLRNHLFHLQRDPEAHRLALGFRTLIGLREHVRGLVTFAHQVSPPFGATMHSRFDAIRW